MDVNSKEKDELMKKYKLTPEKHNKILKHIEGYVFNSKKSVANPTAVIIGGQTGAGKGQVIIYSKNEFKDNNVVIINNDEYREFHPKAMEIAKRYPMLYTKITAQESESWASYIFEKAINEKYNIIFEGTMKNTRIADTISRIKQNGFKVIVRGLAVTNLKSLLSMNERYVEQQKARGAGRMVILESHNITFEGMPNTIDVIEKANNYDILEIFKRAEDGKKITKNEIIYSSYDKLTYNSAKEAVLEYRETEKKGY